MESSRPENSSTGLKSATDELVRGREFTTQLQIFLNQPLGDHRSGSAQDLVAKIMGSITETLSLLNSGHPSDGFRNPATANVTSPCCDDRRTEEFGESKKTPASNDSRRGYKRRKNSETWTTITSTPIDDGHAWRKYGQKLILNAKHPRNYFRCTHKNDQGCQATKQIQKEDDRPVYKTTYMGHHTCTNVVMAPQIVMDSTPIENFLLSFESSTPTQQEDPFFSSFPSIKEEYREEIRSDRPFTHNHSSSEYLLSPELGTFESSGPTAMLPSTPGYSCTTSSHSLDMDVGADLGDFDDVFQFDEEEPFKGSM